MCVCACVYLEVERALHADDVRQIRRVRGIQRCNLGTLLLADEGVVCVHDLDGNQPPVRVQGVLCLHQLRKRALPYHCFGVVAPARWTWVCGRVGVGCVSVCACGRVGVWVCGRVGIAVGMWQGMRTYRFVCTHLFNKGISSDQSTEPSGLVKETGRWW